MVGVPAEQIARAEEKIAGVHCFATDAHVEREWVELAAPTQLVEAVRQVVLGWLWHFRREVR